MSDDLEPAAWEVVGVRDPTYVARGKDRRALRERFQVRADAIARKIELQRDGWAVVSMTPVFPNKKAREERNRKRQCMPFGDFCADWKMKD